MHHLAEIVSRWTGVPVTNTTVTTINALATALAPPPLAQAARAVTGNVAPATASVREPLDSGERWRFIRARYR